MKKLIAILISVFVIASVLTLNIAAANSQTYSQYTTTTAYEGGGPVSVRAAYYSNSTATLDGYCYCSKAGNERSFGAHTYSLTGNRTSSRFSTLSKFEQNFGVKPSSSIRKTCPSMSSAVQAVRYSNGATVTGTYTATETNAYMFCHNPGNVTTSYTLSIFSTIHNYYSSSNDFFMYPTVVNY